MNSLGVPSGNQTGSSAIPEKVLKKEERFCKVVWTVKMRWGTEPRLAFSLTSASKGAKSEPGKELAPVEGSWPREAS